MPFTVVPNKKCFGNRICVDSECWKLQILMKPKNLSKFRSILILWIRILLRVRRSLKYQFFWNRSINLTITIKTPAEIFFVDTDKLSLKFITHEYICMIIKHRIENSQNILKRRTKLEDPHYLILRQYKSV